MATKEELFAAVRLIRSHCTWCDFCRDCPLSDNKGKNCKLFFSCKTAPCDWPDPEEGGGENGERQRFVR